MRLCFLGVVKDEGGPLMIEGCEWEQSDTRLQLELFRCMLLPLGRRVIAAQSSRSVFRDTVACMACLNSLMFTLA